MRLSRGELPSGPLEAGVAGPQLPFSGLSFVLVAVDLTQILLRELSSTLSVSFLSRIFSAYLLVDRRPCWQRLETRRPNFLQPSRTRSSKRREDFNTIAAYEL